MTVSFYLTRPKAETNTSIFARISYEGNQLKYYTPESINPKFWNTETKQAKESKNFKEYPEFNQRLKNFKTDVSNLYRKWVNDNSGIIPSIDTFKCLLDKELKKHETSNEKLHSFFPFFEDFNNRSLEGNRINHKTKKATTYHTNKGFKTTLNHLLNFQKKYDRKIDFKTIDLEFYNDYTTYLTRVVKYSPNTIGDHIKRLKTLLNEATEKGINKNMAFRSKYFAKPSEETDSIYLTSKELKEIEDLNLSKNPRLESVRDLFLIGCHTGLRYSDFSILKPEQIKDGFIQTTQLKTGASIVIPVHTTISKILDKYKGKLPKSISNQKTNDYLKELVKLQDEDGKERLPSLNENIIKTFTKGGLKVIKTYKKGELITTHTARRSFATNEYLAGTPAITIMAITGHKTEKAFLRYIKLTPNEHAKLLQQHWQRRNQLQAV